MDRLAEARNTHPVIASWLSLPIPPPRAVTRSSQDGEYQRHESQNTLRLQPRPAFCARDIAEPQPEGNAKRRGLGHRYPDKDLIPRHYQHNKRQQKPNEPPRQVRILK